MAGLTIGAIGAGGVRWATATVGGAVVTVFGLWIVPAASAPPIFGWWWEYHSFSVQLTTEAPPCSRTHSAKRALYELPKAGFVSAPPIDTANQISSTLKMTATTASTRRRRWTRDFDQRDRRC